MVNGIKTVPGKKFNRMNLELSKFINPNLTWKTVKSGHKRTARRPRNSAAKSLKFCVKLSNNVEYSSESEKFGVAVLGKHFAEKAIDIPIKKRKLLCQGSSLKHNETLSRQRMAPDHEKHEQLFDSKHTSGQLYCPGSFPQQHATKPIDGLANCKISVPSNKKLDDHIDLSGIILLADAACSNFLDDCSDHVDESSVVVEELTISAVDSLTSTKETSSKVDSDKLSIEDKELRPQSHPNNDNRAEVKMLAPSKNLRLHWDLNTMMDEWEEPCYDISVDSQRICSKDIYVDDLVHENLKLERCETELGDSAGEHIASAGVFENQLLSNLESVVVSHDGEDCCKSSLKSDKLTSDSLEFGKHDVPCDMQVHGRGFEMSGSSGSMTSTGMIGTVPGKSSDSESSSSKSTIVDGSSHPPKLEESTSMKSILHEQTVNGESNSTPVFTVCFEPKPIISKCCGQPCSVLAAQGGSQSPKLCRSEGDNLSDCCGSNVSQDEQGHMVGGNNMTKVEAGYESPIEDGELREPNVYAWGENEGEEIECVDYGSDNIYEDDFDFIENSLSKKNDDGRADSQIVEDGTSLMEKKHVEEKSGTSGQTALDTQPNTSEDAIVDGIDEGAQKLHVDRENVHDKPTASGGNLLRTEGSSSFINRRGGTYIQYRPDNIGGHHSRAERNFGSEKFMVRDRLPYRGTGRNESGGPWVDSSMKGWDSRNSHGYPRPRYFVDSAVRSGGFSSHDNNQSRNYSPRAMYRTPNGRVSPPDRSAVYGTNSGAPLLRGYTRDRSRGGSGFHPPGLRRGPQEEYHDPFPCYLERKERCFSPSFDRGDYHSPPRRRSRSKSRARSPTPWQLKRDRNMISRRPSPDYGPYQGDRFHFQKPSFAGDMEGGFISPTRSRRLSPQRSSRCFADRDGMEDHFRDRRSSPVRMYRQSQRFDPIGCPGRLKSDVYFKPIGHSGRFPVAGADRERKYEKANDDRRKHEDKDYMVNQGVSRCDADGDAKQFKSAVDDSLEAQNSPRGEEKKGLSRCTNDGDFATAAAPSSGHSDKDDSQKEG